MHTTVPKSPMNINLRYNNNNNNNNILCTTYMYIYRTYCIDIE